MLRLTDDAEPCWIDLPMGVRVKVLPLTAAIAEAAFAEAINRLRPLKKAAEDAAEAGAPLAPNGKNGANLAWLQALQWQYIAEALARYGVQEWDGVGDKYGQPLDICASAIATFAAHPVVGGKHFFTAYHNTLDALADEGNASAPSSAGVGAGAPNTVKDAPAE